MNVDLRRSQSPATMSANRLGRCSAFALFLFGVIYMITLAIGFAVHGLAAPIVDPLLATVGGSDTGVGALLLITMAAIHSCAPTMRKTYSLIAIAFMILVVGMTSAVHFVASKAVRPPSPHPARMTFGRADSTVVSLSPLTVVASGDNQSIAD